MASKRKVANPLALAVMALLFERPMHPYEMVATMRVRDQHAAIRLRYSSLYSVVGALEREGCIVPLETQRGGRRPERTVYGLTETGRTEFLTWLRELLREPVKEYRAFTAGLAFLAALPPDEAAALLAERVVRLETEVAQGQAHLAATAAEGVARLFLIEGEHELVLRQAELAWVRALVGKIQRGEFDGVGTWRALYAGAQPDEEERRVNTEQSEQE